MDFDMRQVRPESPHYQCESYATASLVKRNAFGLVEALGICHGDR